MAPAVSNDAADPVEPRSVDPWGRLQGSGTRSRWPEPHHQAPAAGSFRRLRSTGRIDRHTHPHVEAWHQAGSRMASARAYGQRPRRRVRVSGRALPLVDADRLADHRRALVGAAVFRDQQATARGGRSRSMSKAPTRSGRTLRCAIYTRKSSEEGLEQEFNSLHAQREACEAFIRSQRHEGWSCLLQAYDDGGRSGGNLERPALQLLLADIREGKVDVVVVYKIDRLTRSLADFAKIVEIFDAKGVSFVSVTQQFNTTTSMGRLTLNVLLSFAQFEREVTGERIRDKIAASKRKGMWMGGVPPLGYAARDRKLVIIPGEAATVRDVFRRYAALGSVRLLTAELEADGIAGKSWTSASGRSWGGQPIARGALYLMLQNRIYRGEIVHKDQSYPGEHEPIIGSELWDAVQARLSAN